jgi:hypothetical protein
MKFWAQFRFRRFVAHYIVSQYVVSQTAQNQIFITTESTTADGLRRNGQTPRALKKNDCGSRHRWPFRLGNWNILFIFLINYKNI